MQFKKIANLVGAIAVFAASVVSLSGYTTPVSAAGLEQSNGNKKDEKAQVIKFGNDHGVDSAFVTQQVAQQTYRAAESYWGAVMRDE
jgi:hypothetical protein